eukprot:TRINITY_DN2246_c3_g1_i1.p1 TRINITY_DN2246_c3_g1~~TRINITY_DN2246_c3_g1_i1.p1  ORF type:complete len:806 (+),score=205.51 TRINITY_DN2246_c3_g1_i1:149-2566(+)
MAAESTSADTPGTKERMLWLWSNLIGQVVTISCNDGLKWEGLMEGKSDDEFDVVLSSVRLRTSSKKKPTDKTMVKQKLQISCKDIAYLQATDVQITEHEVSGRTTKLTGDPSDRELVSWTGDTENQVNLDSNMDGDCGTWDQFADPVNQFKSTYCEEMYTTKLNKGDFSQSQIEDAHRIADEIERKGGGRHDHATWADDYDEEAKHSCIPRSSDEVSQEQYQRAQNSYIPPHLRGKAGAAPSASLAPPVVNPSNDATLTQMNRTGIQSHAEVEAAAKAAAVSEQYEKQGNLRYRKDDGPPTALPEDVYQEPASDHSPPSAPVPQQEMDKTIQPTIAAAPTAVSPAVPTSSLSIGGRRSIKQNGIAGGLNRNSRILDPTGRNMVIQKLSNGASTVSREQEIAKLKEASNQIQEKLDKGKKKEEAKNKDEDDEDGETPVKEAKKLNPNANPFKMPGGGEEGGPEGAVSKEFKPADEPTWKPQLSDKAKESKFICKIIADGIYQKLRQSRSTQTGQQIPIPGDSQSFNHEWDGDDYYWDEENEEVSGGNRNFNQQQPPMPGYHQPPPQQHPHQHPNPNMQHDHQGMSMQPRQQYPFPQQQQQYHQHPQQGMQPNPSWPPQQQPQYQQQPQPPSQWNAPNTGYTQPNYGQQSHHIQQHPQQMSQQPMPQQYPQQGMQHGIQQRPPFQGYQQQPHGGYQPQQQMQVGGMHQYNAQHQQQQDHMMGGPPMQQQQLPTSSHSQQFAQQMPPRGPPNQPQYGQQMGVHDQVGMDVGMQQQYQPNQMHGGHPPGQRRMVQQPNMQQNVPQRMNR